MQGFQDGNIGFINVSTVFLAELHSRAKRARGRSTIAK